MIGKALKNKVYPRLLKELKPHWLPFLLGILGSILFSGVDAYFSHFMKPLLDVGFVERNLSFLKSLPFIILGLFLLRGVASFISKYFMAKVGRDIVRSLRERMFHKLLTLPASYYDLTTSGQLLSKIIYNVDQVASACTNAVTTAAQSLALIIGLFAVMFTINWRLTLLYVAVAPVVAYLIRITGKRMRRLSGKVQNFLGDISQISEEAIEGYKVVKIFAGQQYEQNKFAEKNQQNRNQAIKIVATQALSTMLVLFIGAGVLALTVYLVTTSSAKTFGLSAGGFVAMVFAMMSMLKPMKDFSSVNNIIQQGIAGAESVFDLLDSESEKDHGGIVLDNVKGEIEFKHVTFYYQTELRKPAINDLHFRIQAGSTIALVGRSGSGKSTLAGLVPRFYDVTEGDICIDGHNLHNLTLSSLRQNIAIVSQNVTLFNDTLAKNIAYGCFDASREEIEKAAKAANAMEFIEKLPQGLDTLVGENGALLSGGQRQRIAIARAILKNAPILILDEATSALDTESERNIQQALDNLMQGRTSIVIAHRLSTIENADTIMVMQDGQIIESGNHQELLVNGGAYAELHAYQK